MPALLHSPARWVALLALWVLWAAPAYGQLQADDVCPALQHDLARIDCGEPLTAAAAAVAELAPEQAWQLKRSHRTSVLFIDLRGHAQAERFQPYGVDVVAPYRELEAAEASAGRGSRSDLVIRFSARIDAEVQARGRGRSMPMLLICANGELAHRAAGVLQAMGYLDLSVVAGGVEGGLDRSGRAVHGWRSAGLPGREPAVAGQAALLRPVSY